MTIALQREGELVALIGPSLRVCFRRLDDRWTHGIDVGPGPNGVAWLPLARAVEWTCAAEDPANVVSPVYQEIRAETDAEGPVLLAIGQAGPHHFSASIRISLEWWGPDEMDHFHCETLAEFDVACRSRGALESLASHYDVDLNTAYFLTDERDARLLHWETRIPFDHDATLRSPENGPGCRLAVVSETETACRLRVEPEQPPSQGTTRFRYLWTQTSEYRRETAESLPHWRPPS